MMSRLSLPLSCLTHRSLKRVLAWLPIVLLIVLVLFIVSRLLAFAQLFGKLGPHAGIEITQTEIFKAHSATTPDPRNPVVPKILHQIFHNWKNVSDNTLPEDWAKMRQMCKDRNPDWEFKMWNVDNSQTFIDDMFPWFLPTYIGYKFPIQRVDTMRYFAVRYYGGIYLDLDNGCEESLDALTYLPAFTTDGGLGALSNNIIGGQPEHPWFVMLTESLPAYNWNWLLPYPIIMYDSGQWYLTAIWEKYHSLLRGDGTLKGFEGTGWGPLHRVLMDGRSGADPWVFFNHGGHGGTWGAGDDWFWAWLGLHWIEVVAEICVGITVVLVICMCCVRRMRRRRQTAYQTIPGEDLELQEEINSSHGSRT